MDQTTSDDYVIRTFSALACLPSETEPVALPRFDPLEWSHLPCSWNIGFRDAIELTDGVMYLDGHDLASAKDLPDNIPDPSPEDRLRWQVQQVPSGYDVAATSHYVRPDLSWIIHPLNEPTVLPAYALMHDHAPAVSKMISPDEQTVAIVGYYLAIIPKKSGVTEPNPVDEPTATPRSAPTTAQRDGDVAQRKGPPSDETDDERVLAYQPEGPTAVRILLPDKAVFGALQEGATRNEPPVLWLSSGAGRQPSDIWAEVDGKLVSSDVEKEGTTPARRLLIELDSSYASQIITVWSASATAVPLGIGTRGSRVAIPYSTDVGNIGLDGALLPGELRDLVLLSIKADDEAGDLASTLSELDNIPLLGVKGATATRIRVLTTRLVTIARRRAARRSYPSSMSSRTIGNGRSAGARSQKIVEAVALEIERLAAHFGHKDFATGFVGYSGGRLRDKNHEPDSGYHFLWAEMAEEVLRRRAGNNDTWLSLLRVFVAGESVFLSHYVPYGESAGTFCGLAMWNGEQVKSKEIRKAIGRFAAASRAELLTCHGDFLARWLRATPTGCAP